MDETVSRERRGIETRQRRKHVTSFTGVHARLQGTMFSTASPLSSFASWSTTRHALSDWISCVAAPICGVRMMLSRV